jgi:C4-dicarboxylate-specific signal transduction histidine kinase
VAITDMTERREAQKLLQENDARIRDQEFLHRKVEVSQALRVSTVGELAAGLAHELNQPLSSISNIVEACSRYVRAGKLDPDKLLELLTEAASESVRAAGIVAHLRSFVDKGEPQFELINLAEVVGHVPQLMQRELERAGIALRINLPPGQLSVEADRIQIEQVFVNLIQNAVDSIGETEGLQRMIELSARSVDGKAEVGVRDTGSGVSKEAAGRLFDAFFTTKAQGLGMGLALCRSILEAHHGRIWTEAPADGGPGTVVSFSIPLHTSKQSNRDRAA